MNTTHRWYKIDDFTGFLLDDVFSFQFSSKPNYWQPFYIDNNPPQLINVTIYLTITLTNGNDAKLTLKQTDTKEDALDFINQETEKLMEALVDC